jgi:hypothetical protein
MRNTSFQFFAYFAFVSSSLLIVLRMYVFHRLRSPFLSDALKVAWQNRHLEQGEDYYCNSNGHMGDRHLTVHQ